MAFTHDIQACLAAQIGEAGLDRDSFEALCARAGPALERLRGMAGARSLALLSLPSRRDDLEPIKALAQRFADCRDLVVLGTGGSSLGGQTLVALSDRGFGPPPGRPRLHFMDNVDPDSFERLIEYLDLAETGVVAISKSGGTAETLAQSVILMKAMIGATGEAGLKQRFAVITEPKESPLASLAERFGLARLDHDPGVGGRYSVLSNVGLLPAVIAGLDPIAVREGAAEVLERTLAARGAEQAAPALGAVVVVGLAETRGVSQSVILPYCDRLADFGLWYRQLWAESLGKDGKGTTPIRALGAVDQHSQLQLYLDGPADKVFTVLEVAAAGRGPRIDAELASDPALDYLAGRSLGDLFAAEARATAETLINRGRPTRRIALESLGEGELGALFMHFMLETILAADLMAVDPFDQPAVEEGKVLARRYLQEGRV